MLRFLVYMKCFSWYIHQNERLGWGPNQNDNDHVLFIYQLYDPTTKQSNPRF